MSISSASSTTIQDDSTSHTLSPSSPTPTPSPAFLHIDSSPSPTSSSESSPNQDDFGDFFDIDCDVALPGTEDLFGNEIFENHELWAANPEDFEDANMSADTLDRILLRAEARLKEQEAFAKKISLQSSSTSGKTDVATRVRPNLPAPYMDSTKRVVRVDGKDLVSKEMRDLANRPKVVEDPVSIQRKKIKDKQPDTLSTHFDLPRTKVTPSLRRDLQLIHMRSVLDPKRMYKKQGAFKIPEYSQMGTIIEGPTEYYSSRMSKAERTSTLLEETLKTEAKTGKLKSKYHALQNKQRSGKKAFYRSVVAKRKKPMN